MKRENLDRAKEISARMKTLEERTENLEMCAAREGEKHKIKISIFSNPVRSDYCEIYPPNELADMVLPVLTNHAENELKALAAELETL